MVSGRCNEWQWIPKRTSTQFAVQHELEHTCSSEREKTATGLFFPTHFAMPFKMGTTTAPTGDLHAPPSPYRFPPFTLIRSFVIWPVANFSLFLSNFDSFFYMHGPPPQPLFPIWLPSGPALVQLWANNLQSATPSLFLGVPLVPFFCFLNLPTTNLTTQ